MIEELEKNGWSLSPYTLPQNRLDELVRRKNEYIQVSTEEVEKSFNVSLSIFEEEKIDEIELVKSITRSFLRYDTNSHLLLQAVWKKLKEDFELSSKINYVSLPYPIIHFPLDTSEKGARHKDSYDYIKNYYTTWIPLNDCFHGPIAITEKTHRKDSFLLRQIRIRLKLVDKLIYKIKKTLKPDIRLGEFFVWYGETDHQGLLNTSGKISVALTPRFTNSPLMYETTTPIKEIENYIPVETNIFSRELVQKMITSFKEIQNQVKESTPDRPLLTLVSEIRKKISVWNYSPEEAKRLGFTLTLWAQRAEVKQDVLLFYLYAFFIGTDNFYSLQKLLNLVIVRFKKEDVEMFINQILNEFNGEQITFVVKSATEGKNLHVEYPKKLVLLKSSLL